MLTIVVYHYVRDLAASRYPKLTALPVDKFDGQLDYIARHYSVVGLDDILDAEGDMDRLPSNACVLTFDDGFSDHYEFVFPRLQARGWPGAFFVPAAPIQEGGVLDGHMVQFILASGSHISVLNNELRDMVEECSSEPGVLGYDALTQRWAKPGRYDPLEIILFKRILQVGLPEKTRQKITKELFARHVTPDAEAFARSLYVNSAQLATMARGGMVIGGHGWSHQRLDSLSADVRADELQRSQAFLDSLGVVPADRRCLGYPHGSFDDATVIAARSAGFHVGLSGRQGLVPALDNNYTLARLDTNDLPHSGSAPVCEWTLRQNVSA